MLGNFLFWSSLLAFFALLISTICLFVAEKEELRKVKCNRKLDDKLEGSRRNRIAASEKFKQLEKVARVTFIVLTLSYGFSLWGIVLESEKAESFLKKSEFEDIVKPDFDDIKARLSVVEGYLWGPGNPPNDPGPGGLGAIVNLRNSVDKLNNFTLELMVKQNAIEDEVYELSEPVQSMRREVIALRRDVALLRRAVRDLQEEVKSLKGPMAVGGGTYGGSETGGHSEMEF